jgi:hypothetical protein
MIFLRVTKIILIGVCIVVSINYSSAQIVNNPKILRLRDSANKVKVLSKEYTLYAFGPQPINVFDCKYYGIKYTVSKFNGKIIYISTRDTAFITDEGFKIGAMINEVQSKYQKSEMEKIPYLGYTIKLQSGWSALFKNNFPFAKIEYFFIR